MTGHEPEKKGMKPLDMRLIRLVDPPSSFVLRFTAKQYVCSRYVAMCKRKHPTVPESLTDRLVQMYVELRKDARNNKDSELVNLPHEATVDQPRSLPKRGAGPPLETR